VEGIGGIEVEEQQKEKVKISFWKAATV